VKAAVGGTGGDEIFFGYPRHAAIRLLHYYQAIPKWIREHLVERVVMRFPESTRGSRFAKRAKRFVKGAGLPPEEAYLSWVSLLDPDVRAALLSAEVRSAAPQPAGDEFLRGYLTDPRPAGLLERAADLDVHGYLPEYQLAYMDRMSMAHGLEVRSPFCDYRLVEFVTGIPTSYRLRGMRSKHILKNVATAWIPREIAERKKVGFDSPIGQWAKSDLREFVTRFLAPEQVARTGLLDPRGVEKVLAGHLSGSRDYSLQLWSLLALEAWHRMYIEDGVTDGEHYTLGDLRGAMPNHSRNATPKASADTHSTREHCPPVTRRNTFRALAGMRRRLWDEAPPALRACLTPILSRIPPPVLLGREFRRWLAFAEQSQYWGMERSREYQLSRLQCICRIAYEKSPFYRQWFENVGFNPEDLKSVDDLRRLPLIDRRTVAEHLNRMCTVSPKRVGIDRVSTGGTEGIPLTFYIDAGRSAIEYAYLVASWRRIGYSPKLPTAAFRGRVVAPDRTGLRHEFDPVLRAHYYSTFHMSDEDMRRYLEHLRTLGPCFLHVYPSAVSALASFIDRSGVQTPRNVRGIIAESEISYPTQRELAARVFACRYFSCYGHSEKLVLAAGCEQSDDYHVWPTYGYFELLDEAGNPVVSPGQRGEIVGTGFINTVVPFIRYRTGDYAAYAGSRCAACNREQPLIRDVRGHRIQEMLVLSDGTELSWTALNMHDDTFRNVRQFQFYQDTPGRAVLRIVPAAEFGHPDGQRILHNLDRKLDGRLDLTIHTVESIPSSPRGKAVYVDQRITPCTAMHS
jgi:phenylacetate-CoA ligase